MLIIVLLSTGFGFAIIWTAQIGKLTTNESLLNRDNPELYPFKVFEKRLIKEHEVDYIDLHFVWGVNGIDTSYPNPAEKMWDSEFLGKLNWEKNFNISSVNS